MWRVNSFLSEVNKFGSLTAAVVLFGMMWLISADVIGRYVLNSPVLGTFEIVSIFMAMVIFLGLAYAQEKKRHIYISFVLSHMSAIIRRRLEFVQLLAGFFAAGLLAWYCLPNILVSWQTQEVWMGVLQVPYWPGKAAVGVGVTLLCIRFMVDLVHLASCARRNKGEE